MHTDSYHRIGQSHAYCQDYAGHLNDSGLSATVISDGCSTSAYTDIGSRLLVQTVLRLIREGGWSCATSPTLHLQLLVACEPILKSLGLPISALDATLLLFVANQNQAQLTVWGDGYAMVDGQLFHFSQPDNAPPYLAYHLGAGRMESYLSKYSPLTLNGELLPRGPYIRTWDSLPQSVHLFSDGLGTFEDREANAVLAPDSVAQAFTSMTNTAGSFVQRRIRRVLKDHPHWVHQDDLAQAAFLR